MLQGLVVGAIATLVIGFNWGGWQLGGTVDKRVEAASQTAMVAALAPICAERFQQSADTDKGLVVELNEIDSWLRKTHLIKAGWATFPGGAEPNDNVAQTCARLLSKSLKLN
jgi:hypothetical protein